MNNLPEVSKETDRCDVHELRELKGVDSFGIRELVWTGICRDEQL